jgi:hypothetical protein
MEVLKQTVSRCAPASSVSIVIDSVSQILITGLFVAT